MASETYCGACGDHAPTILGRCASCWGDRPLETALADMALLAREAEEARDADEEIARLARELEEARALLGELTGHEPVLDDERLRYVEIQVNREAWEAARSAVCAHPSDRSESDGG